MPRDPELDALREQVQQAFDAKQAKFAELKVAREEANVAYASLQRVRNAHNEAFEEMKRLREELNESSRNYDLVWGEYSRLKESLSSRIDDLKAEADAEHRMMSECFEQASNEYEYGDRALASSYSQDGHKHKANRDALNAEVAELCQQLKAAREDAQWRALKTDSSEYQAAKARFEQAKAILDSAKRVFDEKCDWRDLLQAAFEDLKKRHESLETEFKKKREEIKLARERQNSKWTELQVGTIDGHLVTFKQGKGKNEGQTLIADGDGYTEHSFKRHHNHYGKNDKNRFPDQPDYIEDSSKHKNDDFYTGPGH